MFEFLKRLLKTQILSIIYSVITITFFELIISGSRDIQYIFCLILVEVIGIGILCFLLSQKYLDTKWLDVVFINMPYGVYCLLILAFYGSFFPISGVEDDYGLGLILLFDFIGCWISITIGLIVSNAVNRRAIHSE